MNELMIFNNPEFGEIRTIEEDGKVLFCGSDVAKALGYSKPQNAIDRHCKCALKRGIPHPQSPDKTIEMLFIPEGDIYRLHDPGYAGNSKSGSDIAFTGIADVQSHL